MAPLNANNRPTMCHVSCQPHTTYTVHQSAHNQHSCLSRSRQIKAQLRRSGTTFNANDGAVTLRT
jgi:hypothetical protein